MNEGLNFYKFSPGGNSTILITDPLPPSGRYAAIAGQLMSPEHLQAEQVGFVHLPEDEGAPLRLDMMGGEFCLNAARCAAYMAFLDWRGQRPRLSVSGIAATLESWVEPVETGSMRAEVSVLTPCSPGALTRVDEGVTLACLPGITHILLDETRFSFPLDWRAAAGEWTRRLGVTEAARGVVWYSVSGVGTVSIRPVVEVPAAGSCCLESSCGSASLALGLMGEASTLVRQPSGSVLRASRSEGGVIVGGPVSLLAMGEVFVDL